jgi:DNA-binding transcriptional MerR regulator
MFRIGDFSRFGRVSVKMLRHYDELGLIKPARVDPDTGYRYYSANQLPRLNRIVALKDMGFRLEQIGMMLDDDLSNEQLRGMLRLRRIELEQQLRETTGQMAQVEARLSMLDSAESPRVYDVVLRAVPPQMMAAVRRPIGLGDDSVPALFEELEAVVARYRARAPLPPLLLYHDADFPEGSEDIEVMVPIQRPMPTDDLRRDGRVVVRELPGQETMACLIHAGGYDGLPAAFAVLLRWIEGNGYLVAGPTREVYLRFGADQIEYSLPDAFLAAGDAEFVTELQIPVAPESSAGDSGFMGRRRWI